MKKTFELNGVQVYDLPVEKLNLKPRDKKHLKERGVMTASELQRLSRSDICNICTKEDGKFDAGLQTRLYRCLNASEYISAETGLKYRPNDNWETFLDSGNSPGENGNIGYSYTIREQEAKHVMSYVQYIEIMKKLHRDFPKLNDVELVDKLGRSNVAKPYIRAMILKELSSRSFSYETLRKYAILFSTSDVFYNIVYDMLKKHEIEEYVYGLEDEEKMANVLYRENRFTYVALTLPGAKDRLLSRYVKIDFD